MQTNQLPTLRLIDRSSDTLYLRSGVTLAFFLPMPFHESCDALGKAFDLYLRFIGSMGGVLKWASIGAESEEWEPFGPKTVARCKKQLDAEAAAARDLSAFELGDGEMGGDAPGYGIKVIGNPPDDELPLEQNLIEMHFPWEVLAESHREAFVEFARGIAGTLPYLSGYASPALHWSEHKAVMAFEAAVPLITAHRGLDIGQNELARSDLGVQTRGARWLTFLGPACVQALGGRQAVATETGVGVLIADAGRGIMLRAGDDPEIDETPRLDMVRSVLAALTLDEGPVFECFFDDDTFAKAWTNRFSAQ